MTDLFNVCKPAIFASLHQYHKIFAACNIQGERAYEFSFNNIAQRIYICIGIDAITVLWYV